jgi:hypothetical protein
MSFEYYSCPQRSPEEVCDVKEGAALHHDEADPAHHPNTYVDAVGLDYLATPELPVPADAMSEEAKNQLRTGQKSVAASGKP